MKKADTPQPGAAQKSARGLVGYDACFTRRKSRVRIAACVVRLAFYFFKKKKNLSENKKRRGRTAPEIPALSPTAVLIGPNDA